MAILDHDHIPLPCAPPDPGAYLPVRQVNSLLFDLESLADSWNALAVTYRLAPTGLWARITNDDMSDRVDVLEGCARQLHAALQRFKDVIDVR